MEILGEKPFSMANITKNVENIYFHQSLKFENYVVMYIVKLLQIFLHH